ncbi:MAG TPA: hypothetical protein VGI60_05090 [Chthoniobacterales bacterium]|jgi:Ca-activated chloride channel family protein
MLTFAYSWLWLLLPLPWLIYRLAPPHRETRQGLVVPFLDRLAQETGQQPAEGAVVMRGGWLRKISLVIFWSGIVCALARPQIIEPPITKNVPVRYVARGRPLRFDGDAGFY